VARDRGAERGQPERGGVVDAAVVERRARGVEHRPGRREIGLADLHVHDIAPRRLERPRGRLHLHHVERRDVGDARCEVRASVHRTKGLRRED
jgi:hypothetical protein